MATNKFVGLITGLAVSTMMIIIDNSIIEPNGILMSVGIILLFVITVGTFVSDKKHSSNKHYYYNVVHCAILKEELIKRGFTDILNIN